MAKAAGASVAAMENMTYFHDIEVVAMNSMKENAKEAIKIFAQKGE